MISLTEMQHGKAIPLSSFFDFLLLKTLSNSASMKLSTVPQMVEISASATQSLMASARAAIENKNCALKYESR